MHLLYEFAASNTTPAQDDGFPFNRDFYNDFTAQVGGPIIKDRLWFFGSYQHQEDSSTQPGVNPDFPTLTESDRMFVKVNYQINDNHRLLFALHNDWYFLPGEQNANTAPTTVGVESGNNPSPNLTYTGIFSANTLVEARFSGFYGTDHGDPIVEGEPRVKPRFYNLDTGQITGGVYYWYDSNVFKTGVSGKVSHYADQFLGGSHDFKFGAQYSRGGVDNGAYGANDFIYTYEYYGEPYAYGYSYDAFGYGGIAETIGVFVDDSWAVNDRLTLNLGLRYDHKVASVPELSVPDAAGNLTGATFPARDLYTWDTISPRLGFNLRLTTDGKTALKGHWGRYYRGIVTGEFVYELGLTPASTFAGSYDLATQQFTSLEEFESSLNKGVDPDYSNPYTDQFIIGFERELTTNWGFSANYVHKRGRNNAAWSATGEYEEITYIDDQGTDATGNPITVLALVSDPGDRFFTIGNDDRMSTDVNAVTITLRKRMSDRWQMTNSLVFMKTSGRLPSSIDSFGRQNASLVFSDFGQNPNDFINTDGRLVNDRPVEFKTSLVYEFPFNLMLAAGWRLQSGKPWARTVRPEGTGLVTEILAEQIDGSRRVSTWNLLDLRAQYAIELGGGTNVAFFGDVFNLFNEDANEEVLSTLGTSESFDFPSFFVLPRRLMLGAKFRF